jgi:carboxyl-terminal processing protease
MLKIVSSDPGQKALPLISILVVVAASLAGGYFGKPARSSAADSSAQNRILSEFQQALGIAQENYAGALNLEAVGKSSIQGMLQQLDPHSAFFTRSEFDDLQSEQRSRFYGIGVIIARRGGRVCVLSVVPGTPAHRAGIRYGDAIIGIDGQNAENWSSEQVIRRVRGERGEPVEITVERVGAPRPITFRIVRDEVKLPSVRAAFMLSGDIGYIALTGGFSSKTEEELTEAMGRLKREGMQQLILDLRGNPGGLLEQAVKVAELFLPPGLKIVEVRGRDSEVKTYNASENNSPEGMPLVVLINRNTASASEVVAGALQDHERALIVGQSSFGKGLVQKVFSLWGGTGLTLTTARYYTPSGRLIQRDYSKVSFYDYYMNRAGERDGADRGQAFHTDLGRTVYGGGGIAPDVEVRSLDFNQIRIRLIDAIFDFVRHLVAGQIAGLRDYRITETRYKSKLSSEDLERYRVTDDLIAAFIEHVSRKAQFGLAAEQIKLNLEFVRAWMRREILTAAFGSEAADQIYTANDDLQVRKAIELLPQARQLAEAASRTRSVRQ